MKWGKILEWTPVAGVVAAGVFFKPFNGSNQAKVNLLKHSGV